MGALKRIKVVLMLLIMLFMIGHDTFPHDHLHERTAHTYNHFVCDNCEGGLLDRLLENHAHANHSHAYSHASHIFRFVKQQLPHTTFLTDWISLGQPSFVVCRRRSPARSKPYVQNLGLLSIGLRAPPDYTRFI